MANEILRKYFQDPSVPKDKKDFALGELEAGRLSEQKLETIVREKYRQSGTALGSASFEGAADKRSFAERFASTGMSPLQAGAVKAGGKIFEGIGNAAGVVGNLASYVDPTAYADPAGKGITGRLGDALQQSGQSIAQLSGESTEKLRDKNTPFSDELYKAGETVGDVAVFAAETVPIVAATGGASGLLRAGASKVPAIQSIAQKSPVLASAVESVLAGSAGTQAAAAINEGRLANIEELSAGAAIDLAIPALGAIKNTLKGFRAGRMGLEPTRAELVKQAKKMGIQPKQVADLQNMNPDQIKRTFDFMEQAEKALVGESDKAAMEVVADQFNIGLRKLNDVAKQAGKKIGKIRTQNIKGVDDIFSTDLLGKVPEKVKRNSFYKLAKNLYKTLDDQGVKFEKGVPNFDRTVFRGNPGDQKQIIDLLDSVKKIAKEPQKSLGEIEVKILELDNILSPSYKNPATQSTLEESTRNVLTQARKDLKNILRQVDPERAEVDDIFSDLIGIVTDVGKKTAGTSQELKKDLLGGVNTYNILRRSQGTANKDNLELIRRVVEKGNKHNISEFKHFLDDLNSASFADSLYKIDVATKPTSFAAKTAEGAQAALTGGPLNAARNVAQSVVEPLKASEIKKVKGFLDQVLTSYDKPTVISELRKGIAENSSPIIKSILFGMEKSLEEN